MKQIVLMFLLCSTAWSAACPSGYKYAYPLTIDHNQVPSNLTNFPYLINGTYTWLKPVAGGGRIQHTSAGYTAATVPDDFQLCTAKFGGTQLNYEVDQYNSTTGASIIWVNIPSLSSTVDTVIYALVGNASVSTSQEHSVALWTASNYVSVYHFGDGVTYSLKDSGPGLNDMTAISPVAVAGFIGGGIQNGGTSGAAKKLSPSGLPSGTAARTMEVWAHGGEAAGAYATIVAYGEYGCGTFTCSPTGKTWAIVLDRNVAEGVGASITPPAFSNTGGCNVYETVATFAVDTWAKLIASNAAGNNNLDNSTFFQDGSSTTLNASEGGQCGPIDTNPTQIRVGGCLNGADQGATSCRYGDSVDEFRIASDVKSADWNLFEYRNDTGVSAPTVGSEEVLGFRRRSQVY